MFDPLDDPELDAQLRDTPVPSGLVERLKARLAPSDEQLDADLKRVGVPRTVLVRLREVPADIALDEELSAVAAAPSLIYSLRVPTISQRLGRVAKKLTHLAQAAAWFLAISVTFAAFGTAFFSSILPTPTEPDLFVLYQGPLSVRGQQVPPAADFVAVNIDAQGSLAASSIHANVFDQPITKIPPPDVAGPPAPGPVGQFVSLVASGFRPLDDAVLMRWDVLGSSDSADDRLPDLEEQGRPQPVGVEPPIARGYDRAFFLRHRVFPPISPAADPRLTELRVPLRTQVDGLERLERLIGENRLPPRHDVRVEDLLASMHYDLGAVEPGRLAIRTAAGPAPLASRETELLLVGVQAGGISRRSLPASHLVLAIDLSFSMGRDGRTDALYAGLDRLLGQLGSRDRLSLVVFNDDVIQVVEGARKEDAATISDLVRSLPPRGGTNLAAGLQQAASLAMADLAGPDAARQVVLVTDSQAALDPSAAAIAGVLRTAGQMGVHLDVLDISGREAEDALLSTWAHRCGGEVTKVHDVAGVAAALLRSLTGDEGTVARDAKLTLRFNPHTVAAYRLIGHEANPLADIAPPALEAEFSAGDAAVALVELWFLPGENDEVGSADLVWTDPVTGQERRVSQRISRLQFAPTLAESAPALVKAALAAEVGETLRGSHEALREAGIRPSKGNGLSAALQVAESNPGLAEDPDVQRLISLIHGLAQRGIK